MRDKFLYTGTKGSVAEGGVNGIAIGSSSWASCRELMSSESERSQLRAKPWLRSERERERKRATSACLFGGLWLKTILRVLPVGYKPILMCSELVKL